MSIISKLGNNFENLTDVLDFYDGVLENAAEELAIKGKTLERATMENSSYQVYYDQKRVELKILCDYLSHEVDKTRSVLFRQFKEKYSRDLGEREINQYINSEPSYLIKSGLLLEIKEIHLKYQAVVDAFTTRGYALNNITKARVAEVDQVLL